MLNTPAHPNSTEARDATSVIHPLTNLQSHLEKGALVIEEGDGVWVTDNHGNRYIEGMSGLWCLSLGYGQQRLVDAAAAQMAKLPYYHLTNHKSHGPVIDLAEKLLEIAPVPMSKIWFANSGSEGNDSAACIAWYYWHAVGKPKKRKIIAHQRAYHGNTIAAASLSGMYYNRASFGLPLDGFLHVTPPHHYRYAHPGEDEEAFATRLADELDALIVAEGPDTVAAFFTEPVMGSGRRDRAAADLLREGAGGAEKARHPAGVRRGDYRVRAHRKHVRHHHDGAAARHAGLRQGAVRRLSADIRPDGERARVRRDRGGKRPHRRVRPQLHLFGPPGIGGGRPRGAAYLRGRKHRRSRPRYGTALPGGGWRNCWIIRWSARCAAKACWRASSW